MSAPTPPPSEAAPWRERLARVILVGGGVLTLVAVLGWLRHTLTLLLVAFAIAYFLNPVLRALQRRGLSRTLAVATLVGGTAVVAIGLALVLVPLVVGDLSEMGRRLPPRIDAAVAALPAWLHSTFGVQVSTDPEAWLGRLGEEAKAALPTLARAASGAFAGVARQATTLFGFAADLMLIPLFAFYLMRDFGPLTRRLHDELVPLRLRACEEIAAVEGRLRP